MHRQSPLSLHFHLCQGLLQVYKLGLTASLVVRLIDLWLVIASQNVVLHVCSRNAKSEVLIRN